MGRRNRKTKNWKTPKKVFFVFLFFFFILYIQLIYLSVSPKIYGKSMTKFASSRNTVKKTLASSRGNIYDVNKNALAINVSSYTIIAYLDESRSKNSKTLNHVEDIDLTAKTLGKALETSSKKIKKVLENGRKKGRYQVELGSVGKGITELKKEEIESYGLPGIDFIESQKRYYPNGNFASYIVGYAREKEVTKYDDNDKKYTEQEIVGELGIESKYNDILKGVDGYLEYQQDRYGYKIAGTKEISIPAENGYDVYLTIDSNIQRFVESAIEETKDVYKPEWLMLNVMDAKTGNILASGTTPSYDPNIRNIKNYENLLVSHAYEPGSTMKIYTYMCAIEKGKYDGNKKFQSGKYKVLDDTINDWNNTGWGKITLDKGFEYSSNVGIANLIKNYLTKEELRACFKKYGFGKTTGIELSNEVTGKLGFNYEIELLTAGFGQGIYTTAIQQLQGASIIANNGSKLTPHIVDKIVNPNTKEVYYKSKTNKSEPLVKKSTIEKMKQLMYNTVNGSDRGTAAKAYKIDGFDLIGKTGTAQIYESGRGYLKGDNNYIFSAVIMFPKDNPEIIIYGAMKKPRFSKALGLSKAVKDLTKNIAKYKNIYTEQSSEKEVESIELQSYWNNNASQVKLGLEKKDIDVIVIGDGTKVIDQYPSQGTSVVANDKVILITNGNNRKMPSIEGWSRNDITNLARLLELKTEIKGYGFADSQSIKSGTEIKKDMILKVNLKSKVTKEA